MIQVTVFSGRSGELRMDNSFYLTLFGGLDEGGLPSEEQEIDSLAVQRHLGNIPESASQVLQYGIGQGGSERTATLRRAILATA